MHRFKQYAALPYVQLGDQLEVCLITSRDTGRWVIPKGWPKSNMEPHELAELEAFEEAGLEGKVSKNALGRYHYRKRLHFLSRISCRVFVYPLKVRSQHLKWPERMSRQLIWVPPQEAADRVAEKELSDLFLQLQAQFCDRARAA